MSIHRVNRTDKESEHPRLAELREPHPKLSKQQYRRRLAKLQLELLSLQQHYAQSGARGVLVFQGFDAAGKGGAIRRLVEKLDPRTVRVHAIGAPGLEEKSQHYLQRFWSRLPKPGTLTIFDRSWYGRVLVERVEGLVPKQRWQAAYEEINAFESMLRDDGIRLAKVFLAISKEEQRGRFIERLDDPFKRWKLTKEDLRNRKKWPAYVRAVEEMFTATHTPHAPWRLIPANDKWHARVEALAWCRDVLSQGLEIEAPLELDPRFEAALRRELGA